MQQATSVVRRNDFGVTFCKRSDGCGFRRSGNRRGITAQAGTYFSLGRAESDE